MRQLLLSGSYSSASRIASLQRCINLYPENTPPAVQPPTPVVHLLTPGLTLLSQPPVEVPMSLVYVIDGKGSVISTGVGGAIPVDFPCTIAGVKLLGDESGDVVVDIWKVSQGTYDPPSNPTAGNSICASALPTLSSATEYEDNTLTGWDTSLAEDDTLTFNVNSVTSIKRLTISLKVVSLA
jgi:hypothetical protein